MFLVYLLCLSQIQESARAQGKIALGVLSCKARRILLGQPNIASAGLSLPPCLPPSLKGRGCVIGVRWVW